MTAFTRTKADGGSCFPGATMHFYHCKEGRYPMQFSTVGLDLAKNTMKLHGIMSDGLLRSNPRRSREAYSGTAQYIAGRFAA